MSEGLGISWDADSTGKKVNYIGLDVHSWENVVAKRNNSSDYVNFLNEESKLSPGIKNEEGGRRDFIGCPVAKIPHSQCRGPGFSPRELDPTSVN